MALDRRFRSTATVLTTKIAPSGRLTETVRPAARLRRGARPASPSVLIALRA